MFNNLYDKYKQQPIKAYVRTRNSVVIDDNGTTLCGVNCFYELLEGKKVFEPLVDPLKQAIKLH